jgi:hypothetical protein
VSSGEKEWKKENQARHLTWLLPSTMLTPPPAAVTATTNGEFASSLGNAATPSSGVVLASAGASSTHGDGSIASE